MSDFESQHPRAAAGTGDGGQFTVKARAEADVSLAAAAPPVLRSADRPDVDVWQHPRRAPRAQAITAYDDEAGWATIGDELTVRYPHSIRSDWVDRAREQLAGLRAAGLVGDLIAHPHMEPDQYGPFGGAETWDGEIVLPSGGKLRVFGGPSDLYQHRQWVKIAGPSGNGWYTEAAKEYGGLVQDEVDHAVEEAVRAHALLDGWRRQVAGAGVPSRHAFARVEDGQATLRIEPRGPATPDMLVRFEGAQAVEITSHRPGENARPYPDEERALADLGRRIGMRGGRKAKVPQRVRAMLEAAGDTDVHQDVVWLLANRRRLADQAHARDRRELAERFASREQTRAGAIDEIADLL